MAEDDNLRLTVHGFRSHLRLRRRTRVKMWWERRRLRRKYGDHIIDTVDECAREAERAFLLGQEHRVD